MKPHNNTFLRTRMHGACSQRRSYMQHAYQRQQLLQMHRMNSRVCKCLRALACLFLASVLCITLNSSSLGAVPFTMHTWCSGSGIPTAYADVRNTDQTQAGSVGSLSIPVDQCPSITAEMAIVMDEQGRVLFARDAYQANPIASITKVMTALVALENAPLTTPITVTQEAARVGESSAHLKAGDTMPLSEALKALLIPSGNDAAISIAESVGTLILQKQKATSTTEGSSHAHNKSGNKNTKKQLDPTLQNSTSALTANTSTTAPTSANHSAAYEAFIQEMNAYASRLGCSNTLYENPHGLDDGAFAGNLHSCAYDQALIALEAMKHPELEKIVSTGSTNIRVKRNGIDTSVALTSHNTFIKNYHFARGIKTGTTDAAGYAFMGAARDAQGRLLVSVVLKSRSDQDRFKDTQKLFEWAYGHFVEYHFINCSQAIPDEQASKLLNKLNVSEDKIEQHKLPVLARLSISNANISADVTTTHFPVHQVNMFGGNITQRVVLTRSISHARCGDEVGTLQFYQNNAVIEEVPLIVYQANSKTHDEGFSLGGVFHAIEEFLGRLLQNNAESDVTIELYNTAHLIHDARSRV